MSTESKDPETKDPTIEEKTKDQSKEEVSKEQLKEESTETPTDKKVEENVDIQTLIRQLKEAQKSNEELKKNYQDILTTLKDDLAKTKSDLIEFKEETKKKEPIVVNAKVKGKYDFTQLIEKMGLKSQEEYKNHCRNIYDRINGAYATINNIRNA